MVENNSWMKRKYCIVSVGLAKHTPGFGSNVNFNKPKTECQILKNNTNRMKSTYLKNN